MNWPAFANPWMLVALAAIGLPVLIHFLTRARPRRIVFPPFKFLVEACAGQQAVHRLRTITLLTLRTLAVLALVLLFARPFLTPKSAALGANASQRAASRWGRTAGPGNGGCGAGWRSGAKRGGRLRGRSWGCYVCTEFTGADGARGGAGGACGACAEDLIRLELSRISPDAG